MANENLVLKCFCFILFQLFGPWFAMLWHTAWCLYFTTTMFLDIFYYTPQQWRGHWWIYFRNWTYAITVITSATEMVVRLIVFIKYKDLTEGKIYTNKYWHSLLKYNNYLVLLVTYVLLHVSFWNKICNVDYDWYIAQYKSLFNL